MNTTNMIKIQVINSRTMKIYRLSFVYIGKAILGKFKQSSLRNRSIISVGEKIQSTYMKPAETKQIKIDTTFLAFLIYGRIKEIP